VSSNIFDAAGHTACPVHPRGCRRWLRGDARDAARQREAGLRARRRHRTGRPVIGACAPTTYFGQSRGDAKFAARRERVLARLSAYPSQRDPR
jgi:hypothetical protein